MMLSKILIDSLYSLNDADYITNHHLSVRVMTLSSAMCIVFSI